MKTKEITICGKQVTLAYCYATEIIYKDITGEDLIDYVKHAIASISKEKDPDAKQTLSAILSLSMAFDQWKEEDGKEAQQQLTLKELMNEAQPAEIGMAMLAVIDLRGQFYHVSKSDEEEVKADEKEGDEKEGEEKNA